jgi:haloacetate dehalogenase
MVVLPDPAGAAPGTPHRLEYRVLLAAPSHQAEQDTGCDHARAYAEYRRCYTPETLHAVCEDYRASASIDLEHDASDAGQRIQCPLLVLWGNKGVVGRTYDVLQTWRDKAVDGVVHGGALDCGHYLPEEAPDEVAKEFLRFFAPGGIVVEGRSGQCE